MSDGSQVPYSNGPNAPLIPYRLYQSEKYNFAGILITSTFYGQPTHASCLSLLILSFRSANLGIVIVLFFRCMDALLNPFNRTKGGINWGLVVHTITMFSFVTVFTGMTLDIQSVSFIDSREFTGDAELPPGPLGSQILIYSKALGIVPSVMIILNQWLADGLLVCSVFSLVARVSNADRSSSCIVATSFMP